MSAKNTNNIIKILHVAVKKSKELGVYRLIVLFIVMAGVYILCCFHTSHKGELFNHLMKVLYPNLPEDKLRIKKYQEKRQKYPWRKLDYAVSGLVTSKIPVFEINAKDSIQPKWPQLPSILHARTVTELEKGIDFNVAFYLDRQGLQLSPNNTYSGNSLWFTEDALKDYKKKNIVVQDGQLTKEAEKQLESYKAQLQKLKDKGQAFLDAAWQRYNGYAERNTILRRINCYTLAENAVVALMNTSNNTASNRNKVSANALSPMLRDYKKLIEEIDGEIVKISNMVDAFSAYQSELPEECHKVLSMNFTSGLYTGLQRYKKQIEQLHRDMKNDYDARAKLQDDFARGKKSISIRASKPPEETKKDIGKRPLQTTSAPIKEVPKETGRALQPSGTIQDVEKQTGRALQLGGGIQEVEADTTRRLLQPAQGVQGTQQVLQGPRLLQPASGSIQNQQPAPYVARPLQAPRVFQAPHQAPQVVRPLQAPRVIQVPRQAPRVIHAP